jgi:hypothetical protein
VLLNISGPGMRRTIPIAIPEGVDLASGMMEPARVRPVFVGAHWQLQTLGLSGQIRPAEVEVVETGALEIGGATRTAYRAAFRTESETGALREHEIWYDREGVALKQTFGAMGVELVLTRRGRFVPADEVLERLFGRPAAGARERIEETP